ncbi:MAG: hypothetical protein LAT50_04720 [Ectothiorhodospiraceae bacterium]|nr:hypothetical protein [Ectothiorhodospiraceae bacterium]
MADARLSKRKIPVLPDVLANTGGVIVSYGEWIQNRVGNYWDEDTVHGRLAKRLDHEARLVMDRAEEEKVSYRTAAYLHGVERIAEAIRKWGNMHDNK